MNTISVVIPVYNTKNYLEKCVNSVVSQSIQNLEVILVDDGSTDGSAELCDALSKKDARIMVVHKSNGGLSSARNCGIEKATGKYITFLDSDDYVSPTAYEELLEVMDDEYSVACMNYVRVNESGVIYPKREVHATVETITAEEYLKELLLHIGDVSVCTKLFPREIIANKRFDENRLNEDLLFMTEIVSHIKSVVFTGKIGYFYLTRQGSISNGYGKAVEDMAINSVTVNEFIQKQYSQLKNEGYRFALFQNMAYLLWVPQKLRNKENQNYQNALQYLRRNYLRHGINNTFLGIKNKLIIGALLVCPNLVIDFFQRKHIK